MGEDGGKWAPKRDQWVSDVPKSSAEALGFDHENVKSRNMHDQGLYEGKKKKNQSRPKHVPGEKGR